MLGPTTLIDRGRSSVTSTSDTSRPTTHQMSGEARDGFGTPRSADLETGRARPGSRTRRLLGDPTRERAGIRPSTCHDDRRRDLRETSILRGVGCTARWSALRPFIRPVVIMDRAALIHDAGADDAVGRERTAVTGIRVTRLVGPVVPRSEWEPRPGRRPPAHPPPTHHEGGAKSKQHSGAKWACQSQEHG